MNKRELTYTSSQKLAVSEDSEEISNEESTEDEDERDERSVGLHGLVVTHGALHHTSTHNRVMRRLIFKMVSGIADITVAFQQRMIMENLKD